MKLIRLPEVLDRTAMKKTSVYKLITEGEFPPPVKIGYASFWADEEIDDWIRKLVTLRDIELNRNK